MVIIEFLLDVILVLDFLFVCKSGVINNLISDYFFVYVVLKLKFFKIFFYYVIVCSYKNYDFENFIFDLVFYVDFLFLVFVVFDVDSKFGIFNNVFC